MSNMRLLTVLLLIAVPTFGQTYIASTFAGTWLPENVPATSISLGQISGAAVDPAGNLFLSLFTYNTVVRVDAKTGILTRVAGNGTFGFGGDNGPASSAQLYWPRALAVDSGGNLFLVDSNNNRIRKVANGVITTVAGNGGQFFSGDGGPATSAQVTPVGMALDSAGNLYVEDGTRVRIISNGIINSVAGTEGIGFATLAVDPSGNIYLADSNTARILKVCNGTVTTVAGNGSFGFSGDNGPATSAEFAGNDDEGPDNIAVDSAGNLYIADAANGRIRKVSNGVITTVAGDGSSSTDGPTASARLFYPDVITLDSAGILYVGDTGRARKIAGNSIITLAGNNELSFSGDGGPAISAQFYQPNSVAVDSAGNVYIADTQSNRIRKVTNGIVTTVAGTGLQGSSGDNGPAASAQLSTPVDVAVDSAGNLYIADINNYRIRKIANGFITTVPGTVGYRPCAVGVDWNGNVYLVDCGTHRVLRLSNGIATTVAGNGTFGPTGDNGPALSAALGSVTELAIDFAGNLYLADSGRIRKVSNGVITTIAGGTGVALDSAGNIYIADGNLGLIRRLESGAIDSFPTNSPPLSPASSPIFTGYRIAVDSAGNIYGSDGVRILVMKPDGSSTPPSPLSLDFVNNAASNSFTGLAPGEIVTLVGSGLGPAQLVSAQAGKDGLYPTQLSGTSVQFNGIAAPLIYTSATQVAAVVPYGVSGVKAQMVVTYQEQTSVTADVAVSPSAPGLFTLDSSGIGQAAAINQNGSINSASSPAPIGSFISLYATGEGQTSPAGVDGKLAAMPLPGPALPVLAEIDGYLIDASFVQYAGAAPGEIAGLMQINVQIPAGFQPGTAVRIAIWVGNASSQEGVTIALSAPVNQE